MATQLQSLADAYVQATNEHDADAFLELFAADAVVDDAGRVLRGRDAIKAWSDKDIFAADVTLEVIDKANADGGATVTAKVDGNFDRTGLPDPVVIVHRFQFDGGKIASLTCRLAEHG